MRVSLYHGFELLAVNNSNSRNVTSIQSVRNLIADSIKKGHDEFNSALNISRHLDSANNFKQLFGALIVLKANEEYYLKQRLINSTSEPTVLTVTKDNIMLFEQDSSFDMDDLLDKIDFDDSELYM